MSTFDDEEPRYIDLKPPEAWVGSTPTSVSDERLGLMHVNTHDEYADEKESACLQDQLTPETIETSSLNTKDREILNHADESYSLATSSTYSAESLEPETLDDRDEFQCDWAPGCGYSWRDYRQFFHHVGAHLGETRVEQADDGSNLLFCGWKSCTFSSNVSDELLGHVLYHAIHTRAKLLGLKVFKRFTPKIAGYQPSCSDQASRNEVPILPSDFICDWTNCGHRFANPQLFYWHVESHVDFEEGEGACRWRGCTYKGDRASRLKRHIQVHTGERSLSCPFCGLFFSSKERIKEHWARIEQMAAVEEPEESFGCSFCAKSFINKTLLQEHQRIHRSKSRITCPHCTKVFPYQSKLDRHIVQVHSGRRGFLCQFCPYTAKTESDLKRHVERHENTTAYKCSHPGCLKSFLTIVSLQTHVRKEHGGPETRDRFVCHLCSRAYSYVQTLGRHLETSHRLEPAPPSLRFKVETNDDGSKSIVNAVPIAPENDSNDMVENS